MRMRSLSHLPRLAILLISFLLLAAIVAVDTATSWEVSLSFFYLIPIALVAWFVGRGSGLAFALLCALAWFFADSRSGHIYTRPVLAYWNAGVQLGFFLVVSLALSSLKRELDRERESARTDSLTGLPNRRAFLELATGEIRRAERYEHKLTIVYLDVDNFRVVNEGEGREGGDRLLTKMANAIRDGVRSADVVARRGEDEFLLLFPETGTLEADPLLSRLREDLGELVRRGHWPVTFSIGAVTFERPPRSVDEMLKLVDELMRSVKTGARGRTERRTVVGP